MESLLKKSSEPSTKKRKRTVNPSFLYKYGIADINGKGTCIVCSKEIAEESLKPNKLQRHLDTHVNIAILPEEARKVIFQLYYENLSKCQSILNRELSQMEKMEMFSYKTAFLIAKTKHPFTESEPLIKPVLKNFCEVFDGEPFAKKINETVDEVNLCNNTLTIRIERIVADLKEQILNDFRNSPWTSLAIDELTDITPQLQLLIFGKFLKETSIAGELLACISLESTSGEDIFNAIDKFFTDNNLDWDKVTECSMDGGSSMMGKINGARGILSRAHPHIKTTYACESPFSSMVNKNDYRSLVTNLNLESCMMCCLTSYTPRYRKLIQS